MKRIMDEVYERVCVDIHPKLHNKVKDHIYKALTAQIKDEDVNKLSTLQLHRLIDNIISKYRDTRVKHNEPIGCSAALVIGENQTQSSLSSHHHAGLKRGATGFERINEILDLSTVNHIKAITTPLYDTPRSCENIHILARDIKETRFVYLIDNYEIIEISDLNEHIDKHPWYHVYLNYQTPIIPLERLTDTKQVYRIYLNVSKLYKLDISLTSLCSMIHLANERKCICIPHPAPMSKSELYIDMFSSPIRSIQIEDLASVYNTIIAGIPGVENAYPVYENLLTNLKVVKMDDIYQIETSVPNYIPPVAWRCLLEKMIPNIQFLDDTCKRFTTTYKGDIRHILTRCPLIYGDLASVYETDEYIELRFNTNIINEFPYLKYADLRPKRFKRDLNVEMNVKNYQLKYLTTFHQYWYIEIICDDIGYIFSRPEIDTRYTFTVSPKDCKTNIGYLACRNVLYNELKSTLNINESHIKTCINYMTLYDSPVSIDRRGIKSNKSEWMTACTFEDVFRNISLAAFVGEGDSLTSNTSRKIVGLPILIGRGGKNLPPIRNPYMSDVKYKRQVFESFPYVHTYTTLDTIKDAISKLTLQSNPFLPMNIDIISDYFFDEIKIKSTPNLIRYYNSNEWMSEFSKSVTIGKENETFRSIIVKHPSYPESLDIRLLLQILRVYKPNSIYDKKSLFGEIAIAHILYNIGTYSSHQIPHVYDTLGLTHMIKSHLIYDMGFFNSFDDIDKETRFTVIFNNSNIRSGYKEIYKTDVYTIYRNLKYNIEILSPVYTKYNDLNILSFNLPGGIYTSLMYNTDKTTFTVKSSSDLYKALAFAYVNLIFKRNCTVYIKTRFSNKYINAIQMLGCNIIYDEHDDIPVNYDKLDIDVSKYILNIPSTQIEMLNYIKYNKVCAYGKFISELNVTIKPLLPKISKINLLVDDMDILNVIKNSTEGLIINTCYI